MREELTDYDTFLLNVHYGKMDMLAIDDRLKETPFDKIAQNKINHLVTVHTDFFEIPAVVIGCKNHFTHKTTLDEILNAINECCKLQTKEKNRDRFLNCVYNRIRLKKGVEPY